MSLLADEIDHQGGGFCPNSTTYCSFGCCGDQNSHYCCLPIGVFIGCGFGALGTVCLLISLFRCRFGSQRNQSQMQYAEPEQNFGPEICPENQMYMSAGATISSISGSVSVECPKYSPYISPPSYETAMAETDGTVIEDGNT